MNTDLVPVCPSRSFPRWSTPCPPADVKRVVKKFFNNKDAFVVRVMPKGEA